MDQACQGTKGTKDESAERSVTNTRRKISMESKTLIDRRLKDKGSCNNDQCFPCNMHAGEGRERKKALENNRIC